MWKVAQREPGDALNAETLQLPNTTMKYTITILTLVCLAMLGRAQSTAFQKLAEVNRCWLEQCDVSQYVAMPAQGTSEQAWIQYHLQLVEQTLRARSTVGLSPQQAAARAQCLNDLHEYRQVARFPVNDQYRYRTPIFIDRHNNFCAVGYLIKASGHEDISRRIAATTNLAYVRDMRYPELAEWADAHGFTADELAWIQPGYPPDYTANTVGKGTNGVVYEFMADEAAGRMYVGGDFSAVDSTIPAANIAYLTPTGAGSYEWHAMGSGLTGPVQAVAAFSGNIFAAGDFATGGSDVAYWDGSAWQPAGCLNGQVRDLAVMNGALYAAGEFEACNTSGTVAFAKWTGTAWAPIPGLTGFANTLYPDDITLIVGGAFSYQNDTPNIIRWSEAGGFESFAGGGIIHEVRDIAEFQDSLFAVCKSTATIDTNRLLYRLANDDGWQHQNAFELYQQFTNQGGAFSLNTMCKDGNKMILGGAFSYAPMVGSFGANCVSINSTLYPTDGEWAGVDGAVNKIAVFNGEVFVGGAFQQGFDPYYPVIGPQLNGIAKWNKDPMSAAHPATMTDALRISPNPVHSKSTLHLTGAEAASAFTLLDVRGSVVMAGQLTANRHQEIKLPELTPGLYVLRLTGAGGKQSTKRLLVN